MTTAQAEISAIIPAMGEHSARKRVLAVSTVGFTLLFAVWLMFGVLAIPIRKEMHLSDSQFAWLIAIAILNGSIWRLAFGIITDHLGGRVVMTFLLLASALPAFLVSFSHSYVELVIYAFLCGFAGNGFSVGIAWNSAWFPKNSQGTALGIFGAGNVGASVTKLFGPALIALVPAAGLSLPGIHLPGGWRFIPFLYAVLLILMAVATFVLTPAGDRKPGRGRSLREMLQPLSSVRVWRFSLYYVIVFGAYVALSVWLPRYYEDVYHLPLASAALLTALFIFPASLLRPVGGYLSDRFGARRVMYWVFSFITLASLVLAVPPFAFTLDATGQTYHFRLSVAGFTAFLFVVGMGMGVGKAAVYKYIPGYFPKDVGAVGGLVGTLGALGGFFLPLLFACTEAVTHLPQTTFLVLALLAAVSFGWLHIVVRRIAREANPDIQNQFEIQPVVT